MIKNSVSLKESIFVGIFSIYMTELSILLEALSELINSWCLGSEGSLSGVQTAEDRSNIKGKKNPDPHLMRNSDQLKSKDSFKQCEGWESPINASPKGLGKNRAYAWMTQVSQLVGRMCFIFLLFSFLLSAPLYCSLYLFIPEDFWEFLFRLG